MTCELGKIPNLEHVTTMFPGMFSTAASMCGQENSGETEIFGKIELF